MTLFQKPFTIACSSSQRSCEIHPVPHLTPDLLLPVPFTPSHVFDLWPQELYNELICTTILRPHQIATANDDKKKLLSLSFSHSFLNIVIEFATFCSHSCFIPLIKVALRKKKEKEKRNSSNSGTKIAINHRNSMYRVSMKSGQGLHLKRLISAAFHVQDLLTHTLIYPHYHPLL